MKILWIMIVMISCLCYPAFAQSELRSQTDGSESPKAGGADENVFQDKVLQQIYSLQNSRDTVKLLEYLKDTNPRYRKAAAYGLASVQSPEAIESLACLLLDDEESVRSAACYALGQTCDKSAEPLLMQAYANEKSFSVKRDILEAIGKCGTQKGLSFVTELKYEKNQPDLLVGQAWAIYRFALHTVVSDRGTDLAFELLKQNISEKARFIAAHYLARTKGIDLTSYQENLMQALDATANVYIRMALVLSMGKASHPAVLEKLKSTVLSDADYRIRVNGTRALGFFDYDGIRDTLFKLLNDSNVQVAITASEYFTSKGKEADATRYFEIAGQVANWRVRVNMANASLTYSGKEADKEKISAWIIARYQNSPHIYEKAWLLIALAGDLRNCPFIETQTFSNVGKCPIICSCGAEALVGMAINPKVKAEEGLLRSYAEILKKAILSGEVALMTSAADALRNPEMNYKRFYPGGEFLTEALEKCKLPMDIEAWQEIQKTIAFFKGAEKSTNNVAPNPTQNLPIDWKLVTSIPAAQCVRIKTTRGDIVIQLMVSDSPGSASNFVKLIREDFYKNSVFHRVVPNFVIQDGCPRGDGNGGPSYTIGSEFGPVYYEEGSVGMASAGKDTEGSQWFITHSPTPHLDGRYTIFAKVISSMETVHQIEVGDKILGLEILPK